MTKTKKKKKTSKVAAEKMKVTKAATEKVEKKSPAKKTEPKNPEPLKEKPEKPEPAKKEKPKNVVELIRHSRYGFNLTDPIDGVVVKVRLRQGLNVIPEKYFELLVNSEYFNDCLKENIVRIPD